MTACRHAAVHNRFGITGCTRRGAGAGLGPGTIRAPGKFDFAPVQAIDLKAQEGDGSIRNRSQSRIYQLYPNGSYPQDQGESNEGSNNIQTQQAGGAGRLAGTE